MWLHSWQNIRIYPNWQLGGRLIRTSALSCAEQWSAITDMTVQQRHATRSVTLCANKDEPLVGVARKLVKEGDTPSLPSQIPSHPSQDLFRELSEFVEFWIIDQKLWSSEFILNTTNPHALMFVKLLDYRWSHQLWSYFGLLWLIVNLLICPKS